MESRIGLPGSALELRRREWIDTLNALVSTLPQLSASDRVSLRPRFRLLQSIFKRLSGRDDRLPNGGFGFENQAPQMNAIAEALLP